MIETAVILAAGMGTRLGSDHGERPKGFLALGERPIVEESVLRLQRAGIRDVVIVTGHRAEHYHSLARRYVGVVRTVHNARFADSGSLYSLYCARDAVAAPFLLLESDLIYEPRALATLLAGPADACLLSGPTGAGDEVYVESQGGLLVAMSKSRQALGAEPTGEFVGINRVSLELLAELVAFADSRFASTLRVDYETDGLVAAAARRPIHCPLVADLLWTEIDDAAHLERARTSIYPRLPAV